MSSSQSLPTSCKRQNLSTDQEICKQRETLRPAGAGKRAGGSTNSREAPASLIENGDGSGLHKVRLSGSKSSTCAMNSRSIPSSVKSTYKNGDSFFHLLSTGSTSAHERIFLISAERFGLIQAAYLASKFHWQCQRPLRALLSVFEGLDGN